MLYAPVQTDKTAESVAEILKEARGVIGDKPLTTAEIDKIKVGDVRSMPGSYQTTSAVMGAMQGIALYHRPDDYVQTLKARTEAQTDAQVNAAAKEIIHPNQLTWVIVGDLSKIEQPLRELDLGHMQVIDADGKPVADAADRQVSRRWGTLAAFPRYDEGRAGNCPAFMPSTAEPLHAQDPAARPRRAAQRLHLGHQARRRRQGRAHRLERRCRPHCQDLGKVTVSVMDRVGPVDRNDIKVRDELEVMARNEAAKMNADTIKPLAEPSRRFAALGRLPLRCSRGHGLRRRLVGQPGAPAQTCRQRLQDLSRSTATEAAPPSRFQGRLRAPAFRWAALHGWNPLARDLVHKYIIHLCNNCPVLSSAEPSMSSFATTEQRLAVTCRAPSVVSARSRRCWCGWSSTSTSACTTRPMPCSSRSASTTPNTTC